MVEGRKRLQGGGLSRKVHIEKMGGERLGEQKNSHYHGDSVVECRQDVTEKSLEKYAESKEKQWLGGAQKRES